MTYTIKIYELDNSDGYIHWVLWDKIERFESYEAAEVWLHKEGYQYDPVADTFEGYNGLSADIEEVY